MALGTCGYDAQGVLGGCSLSAASNTDGFCYSSTGMQCTASTPLAEVCPLDYGGTGDGCQPPNLITTLINIALKPGAVDEPMFAGQVQLQTGLLLVAFICVPWLLMLKPYILYRQQQADKKKADAYGGGALNPLLGEEEEPIIGAPHHRSAPEGEAAEHHHEEHNFSEIVIHQAIETIEFVLGMVSNTASYLRLWALSLAHTELAAVFWEKALLSMIETNNSVLIFLGYGVFAGVTFGVLLCMDVLECFLHALRLHWVEFQNKFYRADGYKFQPFDFAAIVEKAVLE
jgi:V-type H+-transporting ATPase subunit a